MPSKKSKKESVVLTTNLDEAKEHDEYIEIDFKDKLSVLTAFEFMRRKLNNEIDENKILTETLFMAVDIMKEISEKIKTNTVDDRLLEMLDAVCKLDEK